MLAGGGAGMLQVVATAPMESSKLNMQLQGESGIKLTTRETVRQLGLRGLYTGVGATWLRDIPFSFIFFPLFANLNTAFGGDKGSFPGLFAAGALSGSLAAGVVTPADVIKTRLQVRGGTQRYPGGIPDVFRRIVAEEGWAALMKGYQPRMIVQAPLFAITMSAFELQKRYLASRLNR
jgi:hypothetical protein